MSFLILLYLFALGLIFGSFVNALVWRLSKQLDSEGNPKRLDKKQKNELSILRGRSMCPKCKHRLAVKDLIPVFSWLVLRGKCRYCHKPISKEYPVVELITSILFVASYLFWPLNLTGSEWIVFTGYLIALVCLVALAVYDIKYKIVPSSLIYTAIAVFIVSLVMYSIIAGASIDIYRLNMAFLSAFLFFAVFLTIFMMSYVANKRGWSNKDWLGFGDVRLAFLLGLIVGEPFLVFVTMFISSLIGIVFTAPSLINKKVKFTTQIPFGPFLIMGAVLTLWWGNDLLDWYSVSILGL